MQVVEAKRNPSDDTVGIRAGPGEGDVKNGSLDGALRDLGEVEMGRRWAA